MATHFNILAWKIPWTEEPAGLQSIGLQLSMHALYMQRVPKWLVLILVSNFEKLTFFSFEWSWEIYTIKSWLKTGTIY